MSAKSERKRKDKEAKKGLHIVPPVQKSEDDEPFGQYDFRLITDDEKKHIKFNDGEFAFTIEFNKIKGVPLYSAAQFRTMTDLTAEEFKAALPVQDDPFWAGNNLNAIEKILREDWEKQLNGRAVFNDGDKAILHYLFENGVDKGMDGVYRRDTDLTREEFLLKFPGERNEPLPVGFVDDFFNIVAEMKTKWETGRQRVIELAKKHGFVETPCGCGNKCENVGYLPEGFGNSCIDCQEQSMKQVDDLYNNLIAEGFVRNAKEVRECIDSGSLFEPLTEEAVA